jgi:hypothetical protein
MNHKELIKDLMKEQNVSNVEMVKRINDTFQPEKEFTPAALWDRLNNKKNKSLSVVNLNEMLSVLGYKVIVAPADMKTPKDCYDVE